MTVLSVMVSADVQKVTSSSQTLDNSLCCLCFYDFVHKNKYSQHFLNKKLFQFQCPKKQGIHILYLIPIALNALALFLCADLEKNMFFNSLLALNELVIAVAIVSCLHGYQFKCPCKERVHCSWHSLNHFYGIETSNKRQKIELSLYLRMQQQFCYVQLLQRLV